MKYECKKCNYATDDLFNYKRHEKTIKHINVSNMLAQKCYKKNNSNKLLKNNDSSEKNVCSSCNKIFKHKSSLSRHKNTYCKKNIENNEIKDLKLINEKLIDSINKLEEKIDKEYKSDKIYLQKLVTNAGSIVKQTLSVFSFVNKFFINAPVLEQLNNFDVIEPNSDKYTIIDIVVGYKDNVLITKYIGDILIKCYKKDILMEQSLWTSDISRLTYIVRKNINEKKKKNLWIWDKNGNNVKEIVIIPALNYILYKLEEYKNKKIIELMNCNKISYNEINEKILIAFKIESDINNGILSNDILKYMAPYFYLNVLQELL